MRKKTRRRAITILKTDMAVIRLVDRKMRAAKSDLRRQYLDAVDKTFGGDFDGLGPIIGE